MLVLLRHGQSQWNKENRFTGWADVPLTPQGRRQALEVGEALSAVFFQIAFISRLHRTEETLSLIVSQLGQAITVEKDSALNERRYGALQGLNKEATAIRFGDEQVRLWRRTYFERPPDGESMEDCERRTLPFFRQYILPKVEAGKNVLVIAHGNSLRPILRYLQNITPEAVAEMKISFCVPYVYEFRGERHSNNLWRPSDRP